MPAKQRPPKWIFITLGAFVVIFVLSAVFGDAGKTTVPPLVAAPASNTSQPSSTSVPPPAPPEFMFSSASDVATIIVVDAQGNTRTVHVSGLQAPAANGCYSTEATKWASGTLSGETITIPRDGELVLSNGLDYATNAIQSGYGKASSASNKGIEAVAHSANLGLWGPPCHGDITHPEVVPTTAPAPVPRTEAPDPEPVEPPEPPRTTEPAPADSGGAYYKNCTAARAAGVTPLLRGEPGYSSHLDRDGDGVACEN